jgi:hypothetical protein
MDDEQWRSWVGSLAEVEERRQHARRLTGLRLAAVRYCLLDYAMPDRPLGQGPRLVVSAAEWERPSFRHDFGDTADHGVELVTENGQVFTVSWDSPGWHEGIWLRELPLIGKAVTADANTAIWDVSLAGRWDEFIGHEICDVRLHYRHWAPDEGYWCSRITVTVRGRDIEFLGGKAESGVLAPSADDIAVLFPPIALPEWARYDDEL